MDVYEVPKVTAHHPRISAGEITFVDYSDRGSAFRTRVMFDQCAVSFVQNGQKHIYRAADNTVLTPGYGMLIPVGNSIIAEHSNNADPYSSVIIFFPRSIVQAFVTSRPGVNKRERNDAAFIHFKTNTYIREYVRNIKNIIATQQCLSADMALLKLNELLTALYELTPHALTSMFNNAPNVSLKLVVENNLFSNLTLDELAFLSNRSLSSFKRDFEKNYSIAPQRYIRERKLDIACTELAKGRSASEIYLEYGYQHVSNFITAFKRKYGVTPADYRKTA